MSTALFQHLETLTNGRSARSSSWDRTGANHDFVTVRPGQTAVLADVDGPGRINHIYWTGSPYRLEYRWAILRMYWDGEQTPSVEVPLGDFFCVSHCSPRGLNSLIMTLNTCGEEQNSFAYNTYFPMSFAKGARITLENQGPRVLGGQQLEAFWFHVDYERFDKAPGPDVGRFHAQWRREDPTRVNPAVVSDKDKNTCHPKINNLDGKDNYVILEAKGKGHLAGLHFQVDNICGGWWGEGDDMIFIDGDTWPPSLHGTGTEEIFAGQPCPPTAYNSPYAGFIMVDGPMFSRFSGAYRWFVTDPVRFQKEIRWSIEHGHANSYENDYTSVAYWYQTEPHAAFPALPPVDQRIPRFPQDFIDSMDIAAKLGAAMWTQGNKIRETLSPEEMTKMQDDQRKAARALTFNRFGEAPALYKGIVEILRSKGIELREVTKLQF